jgi:hypothetical protein
MPKKKVNLTSRLRLWLKVDVQNHSGFLTFEIGVTANDWIKGAQRDGGFWDKGTFYPWLKVNTVTVIPDPTKDPGR